MDYIEMAAAMQPSLAKEVERYMHRTDPAYVHQRYSGGCPHCLEGDLRMDSVLATVKGSLPDDVLKAVQRNIKALIAQ